jgi:hypothetical protein
MTIKAHSLVSLPAKHPIHKWEHANAAARAAETVLPADLGAVSWQSDDDTFHVALTTAPTWLQFLANGGDATFQNLSVGGSLTYNITVVNAATYDLATDDYILHVTYTATGPVTSLTLPSAQAIAGRMVYVKDAGGNASANNITIDTEGPELIDGVSTLVMVADYEWLSLYSDGTNWYTAGG